jgi:glucose/arabinose dehydrogenase
MQFSTRVLSVAALAVALGSAAAAQTSLDTVLLQSGFLRPVWAGSPPGDKARIFVVEQHTGRIEIVKNGVLLATPFLTVTGLSTSNEEGLLGLAFDPNFEVNGKFYVYFTAAGGSPLTLRRYQVTAGPPMTTDIADATTATTMLTIAHPTNSNHNGGNVVFGPDGYLYMGTGDGGSANDPSCNAQNKLSRLGKLLRLDVSGNSAVAPATNPFVGNPAYDPMIWALGLRNPWRWSFDAANGDLYIGDVGQGAWEEVDYVPASAGGGQNYGWRIMEGNSCTNLAACNGSLPCNDPGYTDPIHVYSLAGSACAVTGGVVYRGCAIPDLKGTYFFADYCSAAVTSFKMVAGSLTAMTNRTAELDPPGTLAMNNITHIGEDACGEILICDQSGGELYKIVPGAPAPMANLGGGKVGGNGKTPDWSVCGLTGTGQTAEYRLIDGPANRLAILFISFTQGATPFYGATLVPGVPIPLVITLGTDANGEIIIPNVAGGGGPVSFYSQWAIDDPGASLGVGLSNAIRVDLQP